MKTMTTIWRPICAIAAVPVICVQLATAQKTEKIVITEPGVYQLADLFKKADTVALVKIVSGDAESYDIAVYKATVLKSFKGTASGKTIYFGPYIGERVGWEYVLFLRNVSKAISPQTSSNGGFGTVNYAQVFNEGYSSMMTSYECVFDGNATDQKCDYGIRVCTDYVVLPKSTRVFPPLKENTAFGCRWVRKKAFISMLEALENTKK